MNTNTDGVSAMSAELGGDMPGDDDGDLQTRYDMLKSWLVEADASNDRLKKHLHNVLEIAYTWQPGYATKMDRDTLALAAESIAYEPHNIETTPPIKTPLDRASDLHGKAFMPWAQAEKLALEEDGICDAEVDELIGNASSHAIVGLLDGEEMREFVRSILVHQYALKPNTEAQGRR